MFDKEQPYLSVWQTVASTIRGDKLSKRQKLLRILALFVIVLLGLDRLIDLVRH